MLAIRLTRVGRKNHPLYRLVAAEHSKAVTGKFVEILGSYNPHTKELILKEGLVEKHLKNGAQPSNRAAILLKKEGIKLPDWVKIQTKNRAPKTKGEGSSAPDAPAEKPVEELPENAEVRETPTENSEEKPAEEAPADEVTENEGDKEAQ